MRVLLDTNILLSALMSRGTPPDKLYQEWRQGRFILVSCERQLEELKQVSRRPFFLDRLKPSEVGRMVNDIRRLARMADPLPDISASPDSNDDFLLAAVQVVQSDYLVTGDKSHLLTLQNHGATRIVTAREMVRLFGLS